MENILLNATEDTPDVVLDINSETYMISGRSLPENAMAFYIPIIEWLKEFKNLPNKKIVFHFKLDYFNTASAKQITKLMLILQELAETKQVEIKWHYFYDDADMKSSGLRFSKLIKANIELIPYYDED